MLKRHRDLLRNWLNALDRQEKAEVEKAEAEGKLVELTEAANKAAAETAGYYTKLITDEVLIP